MLAYHAKIAAMRGSLTVKWARGVHNASATLSSFEGGVGCAGDGECTAGCNNEGNETQQVDADKDDPLDANVQ